MKKLIAPLLLLATSVASQANPVTLTAIGSHVEYGSSDYHQPDDWRLVVKYDSGQTGAVVKIDSIQFSEIYLPGTSTAYADGASFGGDVQITDEDDGDNEGDLYWSFGTTGGVPLKTADLGGPSQVNSFYLGRYTEYLIDSVTVETAASVVPEPGARACHQLSQTTEAAKWTAPRNAAAVLS